MLWKKKKKKEDTYYIVKFNKKIDKNFINSNGKKSFSVEKKKQFKGSKVTNRRSPSPQLTKDQDLKKKNFTRKFIEQQATKDFIKKENKPTGKANLNSKVNQIRDFKLTISRALNVEEIEIKQEV